MGDARPAGSRRREDSPGGSSSRGEGTTKALVAVLAGGRGRRLGGSKALVPLGGRPLLAHVLDAARGFETVVVAKRATELPAVDVPVWIEPDEPSHPLCGLVAAVERGGPLVAVACDQPWVTGELLARLAAAGPAVCAVDGELEPFPGHYVPEQLEVLRAALAEEASLRRTLARLDVAHVDVPRELVASVNTPEDLLAAETRAARGAASPGPAPTRGPA